MAITTRFGTRKENRLEREERRRKEFGEELLKEILKECDPDIMGDFINVPYITQEKVTEIFKKHNITIKQQ